MSQMTPEVAKLLEQALSLSVEEQEALADSLISNLGGKVDEGVLAAWNEEIGKRIADLDSGRAKTIPWTEVRRAIWRSCPVPTRALALHEEAAADYDAAFDWYLKRSPNAARAFDAEFDRALGQILKTPRRWAHGSHQTRRFLLHKFPYLVIYREHGPHGAGSGCRPHQPQSGLLEKPYLTFSLATVKVSSNKKAPLSRAGLRFSWELTACS